MNRRTLGKVFLSLLGLLALFAVLVGGNVVYTLWRHEVFVPPTFDETPPEIAAATAETRVLVFSKTNSFRHVDAIPAANELFRSFAEAEGWSITFTENAAVHNAAELEAFDLIVWNNVSGDVLTLDQRAAFRSWIEGGGPVLAIHATGGDPVYQWDWHPAAFIRAQFIGHPLLPQFQEAVVKVENRDHPAMTHLPANWTFKDEWYSFKTSPREKVHVLASLDESTYNPSLAGPFGSLRMGDHPIIWYHEVGKGTVFYSALGHRAAAYSDMAYRRLLVEAARWLLSDQ
jgi:hypothetical protein